MKERGVKASSVDGGTDVKQEPQTTAPLDWDPGIDRLLAMKPGDMRHYRKHLGYSSVLDCVVEALPADAESRQFRLRTMSGVLGADGPSDDFSA